MTQERVKEIAIEVTRTLYPQLEVQDQRRFNSIVELVTTSFVRDYDIEDVSDGLATELIETDIKKIFEP